MVDGKGVGMNLPKLLTFFGAWIAMPPTATALATAVTGMATPGDVPVQWHFRLLRSGPAWVVVLAVAVVVLWVVVLYAKEKTTASRGGLAVLVALRFFALGLLLLLLAGPTIERRRTGKPRLALVVDRSASMNTPDCDGQTRLRQWQQLLVAGGAGGAALVDRLQASFQVDVIPLADQFALLKPTSHQSLAAAVLELGVSENGQGDGNAGATRLGDAVDFALRELPGPRPTAIVVLSDGISTRGQPLATVAQRARAQGVPIYTVAIGSEQRQPDVAFGELIAEETVFPGDAMLVEATVRATGFAGREASVTLRDVQADRQLAQTTVELPPENAEKNVRLLIRPTQPGRLDLELQIEILPGETNVENNTTGHEVQVRDQPIRVLLVQSGPSYEYRAMKSLLQRDPAIQLHVRLQEADREFAEVDPTALRAFPLSEQELFAYDVVLLGDVDPGLLPRMVWPMLLRFVSEQGGGLAIAAGPRFMPSAYQTNRAMRVLMPIEPRDANPLRAEGKLAMAFPILPTAFGRRAPCMQLADTLDGSNAVWKSLPPVTWLLEVARVKRGARILAECPTRSGANGPQLPVILRHYVGAGEVLMHLTDETWRWRWRTDDQHFARYWGQAVRRLARGRLVRGESPAGQGGARLSTDRRTYRPGESVRVQARYGNPSQAPAEDQLVVHLQSNVLSRRELVLHRRLGHRGRFVTTMHDLPAGEYELEIAVDSTPTRMAPPDEPNQQAATARFAVRAPPRELARIAVDRRSLAEAARISHGKTYTVETADQLLVDLPPAKRVTLERLPPYDLASSHVAIGLFSAILATEWLLRRRWGML